MLSVAFLVLCLRAFVTGLGPSRKTCASCRHIPLLLVNFSPDACWHRVALLVRKTFLSCGQLSIKRGRALILSFVCTLFGLICIHETMAAHARELIRHACAHLLHNVCVVETWLSRGCGLFWVPKLINGFVIVSLAVLPLAVGYALYWQYACRTKALDFFPCHYKTEAGTFARLLQMVLTQLKFPSGSRN